METIGSHCRTLACQRQAHEVWPCKATTVVEPGTSTPVAVVELGTCVCSDGARVGMSTVHAGGRSRARSLRLWWWRRACGGS